MRLRIDGPPNIATPGKVPIGLEGDRVDGAEEDSLEEALVKNAGGLEVPPG